MPKIRKTMQAAERTFRIRALRETANKDGAQPSGEGFRAEIVVATETPVMRRSYDGPFLEVLSLDPKHVRLERINNGAPLLDSHQGYSLAGIIGVVESARIDKGELVAVVLFSSREEVQSIVQDVRDGIIRNVSVGYNVYKFEKTNGEGDGKMPTMRAVDWEPYEASLVPVGADDAAGVRAARSQQTNEVEIITEDEAMFQRNQAGQLIETATGKVVTEEFARSKGWVHDGYKPPALPTGEQPAPAHVETERAKAEAVQQERARVAGIDEALRAVNLNGDTEFRASLIGDAAGKGAKTLDESRKLILDKMAANGKANDVDNHGGIRVVDQSRENRTRGIENALMHRINPGSKLEELGRKYRGLTLLEIARETVRAMGINPEGMDKMRIAAIALGSGERAAGMNSTSDFPEILANVANLVLRNQYALAPRTFLPWARRVSLPDFKLRSVVQFGEAPALEKVNESGEFKYGTIGEGKETYKLSTYGKIFAVTRQVIINDSLDALSRMVALFSNKAASLESDIVYAQITANGPMGDGVALFDAAAHKNLYTGGGVAGPPGIGTLGDMREGLRLQKGLSTGADAEFLNLLLKFILIPANLETVTDQLLSAIVPAQVANAVPAFVRTLQPIVEPRLDANSTTAWYGVVDPAMNDTLEYGYLDGQDGPYLETRNGFEVDGLEIKCRHDFAAKVIDWRSFAKNAGA